MPETAFCLPCQDNELVIDVSAETAPGNPYRISYLACGHHTIESWSDTDGANYQIRWEDTDA